MNRTNVLICDDCKNRISVEKCAICKQDLCPECRLNYQIVIQAEKDTITKSNYTKTTTSTIGLSTNTFNSGSPLRRMGVRPFYDTSTIMKYQIKLAQMNLCKKCLHNLIVLSEKTKINSDGILSKKIIEYLKNELVLEELKDKDEEKKEK